MSIESINSHIDRLKYTKPENESSQGVIDSQAEQTELIGGERIRARVLKVFRQRRPESADHYLKPVGL